MNLTQLHYAMALQAAPHIGDIKAKKLIQHCGSPEAVFKTSKKTLQSIGGVGSLIIKSLQSSKVLLEAEKELRFIEQHNIQGLYFEDNLYPYRLKHCIDGPIVLFQKGRILWDESPIISIVGTRQLTPYGKAQCESIVKELSVFNPIIVSGFAYGVDITAHKMAINMGLQTVGCMAQGLQKTYPHSHKKYRELVERRGGFVTDFWSSSTFSPSNFIRRNRLIAGLSQATIVVESSEKGGSLSTARFAFDYNREVFAVPGRVDDIKSIGCNNLIKTKQAHLVSTPADVPYILNWDIKINTNPIQKQLFTDLSDEEKLVYEILNMKGKMLLDLIALNCNMPTSKTVGLLLNLELKGVVRPLPGKTYELT